MKHVLGDPGTTLFEYGAGQLRRLQSAVGVDPEDQATLLRVYEDLTRSWGHRPISETPPWSAVTDDCSPFEFSVAISNQRPELRMIVEAQSEPASAMGYWRASIELSRHLEKLWAADLERLKKIESLFQPNQDAWFATFHGAVLWPASRPSFKIYLNPAARGRSQAPHLTESALSCMGLLPSWSSLKAQLERGGMLHYLALDLTSDANARFKVYVRFHAPRLCDLSRAVEMVDPELASHVDGFATVVFGRGMSQLPRPAIVTYTLRAGSCEPVNATCHLGSFPFAGTDLEISDRVARFMTQSSLDAQPYRLAIAAMREGFDQGDKGIHNHLSIQRDEVGLRVTIYLCPRVYLERFGAIGYDPQVAWPSPVGRPS